MNIKIYNGDLNNFDLVKISDNKFITLDTETTGLDPIYDNLCLIQIYDGENVYLLKYDCNESYDNFKFILKNKEVKKVFHHGNFDLRFLMNNLKFTEINNVGCTKISAKLLNGVNENSSLKYLVDKYLGIRMDKDMQTSDWSKEKLSKEQLQYACNDVTYLYELWLIIEKLLQEKDVYNIAKQCFGYLPTNAMLHNKGIENIFIY